MKNRFLILAGVLIYCYSMSLLSAGCAQIGMPTGGSRDSLAPVLVKAGPMEKTVQFKGKKITLTFDEYVEIEDVQQNVLVSPLPKNTPDIRSNLRNITIRLKDTLLANTTYSINFGNAIKDVNEGNIFKNYTYTFSTGAKIDSLKLNGKVFIAETGRADSTMIVMLYRNANDSSVRKVKPDYIARVSSDGSFDFRYLPASAFKIYALVDGDGGKTYNSPSEIFAFAENNTDIVISDSTPPITLYASALEKPKTTKPVTAPGPKPKPEKKIRYETNLSQSKQDLLSPLQLRFIAPLKTIDEQKIFLSDTNYNRIPSAKLSVDSTRKIITFTNDWQPEANYILFADKDALADSAGNSLVKSDTIRFVAKKAEDYGRVILRFTNLDLAKHPVLQILENEMVKYAYPLTSLEWTNNRFIPGEYGIRILYDDNNNGIWDPGNYSKNLQPEKAVTLPQKLSIRANWDNEREIKL